MKAEVKNQREQFYALQGKYKPIIDILTDKQEIYRKKYQFKGIITGTSPFIYRPQILFLGYNSSGGENYDKLHCEKYIPLEPRLNEDNLMFFKRNSARGNNSEWYKLNQPVNNAFPRKIVDLLYELATLIYPEKNNEKGTNQEPFWVKNMDNSLMSMMYINLYPIATPDGNSLIRLLGHLKREEGIPECCKKKEWNLRKYMVEIMHQMVNVIEPKVIVCMGSQTFHDYTYTKRERHLINDILTDKKRPNIIGFSRKGAWETNIPNIAKAIYYRIGII